MPLYSYEAVDAAGRKVRGEIEGTDPESVRNRLVAQGFESVQISVIGDQPVPAEDLRSLTASQGREVVRHLAYSTASMAPLADGLRAASYEATSYRVSRALRHLAREIDRGRQPLEVLADARLRIPDHLRGLVAAATRTGQLGPVLDELMEHDRKLRSMAWGILGSLAYPFFVLMTSILVLGLFLVFVVPEFEDMFLEFDLQLPAVTVSLIEASRTIRRLGTGLDLWVLIVFVTGALVLSYLAFSGRGGARLQRLLEMMPLVGPLWSWAGASSFFNLLAMMLDQNVPLGEALTMTGRAMSKADLRQSGDWLSRQIESGQSLSELVEKSNCLPATSVPVLRWGEKVGALNDAARTLAQLFAGRVAARTTWLRSASPPIVYLFVVISIAFAVTSLFLPLVSLIQGLS